MPDYVVRFRHNRSVDFSTYRVVTARSRDDAWSKVVAIWPWATGRHVSDYHPGAGEDEDYLWLNSADVTRLRTTGPFAVSAPLSFGTVSAYVIASSADESVRLFRRYFPSARAGDITTCCTSNSDYQYSHALQNTPLSTYYARVLLASVEMDLQVEAVSRESARSQIESVIPACAVLIVVKAGDSSPHVFRPTTSRRLDSLSDADRVGVWQVTLMDRNGRRPVNSSYCVLSATRDEIASEISEVMQSLRMTYRIDVDIYTPRSRAKTIAEFIQVFNPDTGSEYAYGVMENGVLKFVGHPCTYRNLGVTLTKCWANARLFRSIVQAECCYSNMHNDLSEQFGLSDMELYVREQKSPPRPLRDRNSAVDQLWMESIVVNDDDDDDDYAEESSSGSRNHGGPSLSDAVALAESLRNITPNWVADYAANPFVSISRGA